jgi:hypothetical protein
VVARETGGEAPTGPPKLRDVPLGNNPLRYNVMRISNGAAIGWPARV